MYDSLLFSVIILSSTICPSESFVVSSSLIGLVSFHPTKNSSRRYEFNDYASNTIEPRHGSVRDHPNTNFGTVLYTVTQTLITVWDYTLVTQTLISVQNCTLSPNINHNTGLYMVIQTFTTIHTCTRLSKH